MTILLLLGSQTVGAVSGESIGHSYTRARTYTQGSSVKIWVDILDTETRLPVEDIGDITALIVQPDGTTDERTPGAIDTDDVIIGRYSCIVDTSPLPGQWLFQFATTGEGAVVAKARFHVRAALVAMA